ncbi:MAG: outer membrane lipoprotein carrier protein LolA [Maricaulaceae bacterium]|nr:outer membrane lipoprotein carrier protein LolA [Maricaulaceae bacterium]
MIDALILSLALFAQDADPETGDMAPPLPEAELLDDPGVDADAALAEINAALNRTETMRARFIQIAPDFSFAEGSLYLRRPGRLRFEYDPPTPLLIVADGSTVAVRDQALNVTDRAPLRATPLWWILKPQADLAADAEIERVWARDGYIYVAARDRSGEMEGRALFLFHDDDYSLAEWFVTDALGQTTRMILSEVEAGVALDPRLFILDDEERRDPRRR